MSERENDNQDSAVDPPVDQPGGQVRTEGPSDAEAAAVDPPVDQPGGGRTES